MKIRKLVSVLITVCMVMSMAAVNVSATITENDGKGTYVSFNALVRNSPSGSPASITTGTDDSEYDLGTTHVYTCGSHTSATCKIQMNFATFTAADKVYVSFYYRAKTDDTYVAPKNYMRYDSGGYGANISTSGSYNVGTLDTTWRRFAKILDVGNTRNGLMLYAYKNAATDSICLEFAKPELMYFGAGATDAEINEQIAESKIESVSISGTPINLSEYPTSYTTTGIASSDISATAYHSAKPVEMTSETVGDNAVYTLTSYAPSYNFLDPDPSLKSTYTVTSEAEYVEFDNSNMGTAVIGYDPDSVVHGGVAGDGYWFITKGTDDATFDEYYSIENDAFSEEGSSNINNLVFNTNSRLEAAAGGYVYVSFYYRSYNTFTSTTTGNTVTGVRHRVYPSLVILNGGTSTDDRYTHPTVSARHYFDTTVNPEGSGAQAWQKFSYMQPLTNSGTISALKLALPLSNSEGIISASNEKLDIANVVVMYFGVPTGNATGNTSLISSTITDAINTAPAITAVEVDGTDYYRSGTAAYSVDGTELSEVAVSGNYGTKFVKQTQSGNVYTCTAYAPGYDWLSPDASLTATCTVTVNYPYTYDDYVLKSNGVVIDDYSSLSAVPYTVEFNVSCGSEAISHKAILAAYSGSGDILRFMDSSVIDVNVAANTTDAPKSVTLTGLTDAPTVLKLFVFDSFENIKPCINAVPFGD